MIFDHDIKNKFLFTSLIKNKAMINIMELDL